MFARGAPVRLVLVMVGLPARGKTHIARRVARYLNWRGVPARVFNVGSYRRERIGAGQPASFFDPDNREGREARHAMAMAALDDVRSWLQDGRVAIYDATNITRERRAIVKATLEAVGAEVVFIESVCTDPAIIASTVRETKVWSPDYAGQDPDDAVADFLRRIAHYERAYEPVDDRERYIRLVDVGRQVVMNRIGGWLLGGVVNLLACVHLEPRAVYLTRHGESEFNAEDRIGGDSPLTARGRAYAELLASWLQEHLGAGPEPEVWTSTLQRTQQTAAGLPWPKHALKELDEIDAGSCDGLTYAEIQRTLPDEFTARRADKLQYRYPRGESYVDVIRRLEPVVSEVERQRRPLVVVAHQAVLRVLQGYLTDVPAERIPHLPVPLHTVVKLTPHAYGAALEQTRLIS